MDLNFDKTSEEEVATKYKDFAASNLFRPTLNIYCGEDRED